MLTIDALREFGADTAEGVARCMGNEAFYLRMVGMVAADTHMAQLEDALSQGNLDAAFEAVHALKGVLANLALKPVLAPISQMTELLRARTQTDYQPLPQAAKQEMNKLLALIGA